MWRLLLGLLGLVMASSTVALGCTVCRPKVEAGIYTPAYSTTALVLLLPILLLVGGSLLLYYSPKRLPWKTPPLPDIAPR